MDSDKQLYEVVVSVQTVVTHREMVRIPAKSEGEARARASMAFDLMRPEMKTKVPNSETAVTEHEVQSVKLIPKVATR